MAKGKRLLPGKLDLVFSTFIEVSSLITTGASISRIITPILSCGSEILGGKAAFAILKQNASYVRISYGYAARGGRPLVKEDKINLRGLAGAVYRSAKLKILHDVAPPKEIAALSGMGRGVRSGNIIAAALEYQKTRLGTIGVLTPRASSVEAQDLGLFELLAREAGIAVKNAREFERTQTLSITDGLTGAYNYRFLIDAMRKEIGRAERFNEAFSIIMADVDSLKDYNDVHGHLRGSEVIKQVAQVISKRLRSIDMLCKYGGDEFVVLLPRTLKDGAAIVAERLRDGIEKHDFPGEEVTGSITASFGIASYPQDGATFQKLVSRADRALFTAKRHGRNMVWLSGKRTPYSSG